MASCQKESNKEEMKVLQMKWIEAKSYEEMSVLGAQIFANQLKNKSDSVLGLATGSTPIGLYKELVKKHDAGEISFAQVKTFNLDEYVGLSKDSECSYYYFMHDNLFYHVNIDENNVHIPSGDASKLEETCAEYEKMMEEAGGIDVQLLGIGLNGHIGFNEPGTAFDSVTHVVELTQSTREANKVFFDRPEDVPTHAVTMGISSILKAKKIVLLISGASKQEAFDFLKSGEVTENFPASALHNHPDVTVIYTGVK